MTLGKEFEKQLIEEGINPEEVESFISKYDRLSNQIVTNITMIDGKEYIVSCETAWYASRKNKRW